MVVVTPITVAAEHIVAALLNPNQQNEHAPAVAGPSEGAVTPVMEELTSGSAFSKIYSLLLTVFGPSPVLKTMRPS